MAGILSWRNRPQIDRLGALGPLGEMSVFTARQGLIWQAATAGYGFPAYSRADGDFCVFHGELPVDGGSLPTLSPDFPFWSETGNAEAGGTPGNPLNGGWVVAFWDQASEQLTLARDPVGIRAVYWAIHDGMAYFATDLSLFRWMKYPLAVDSRGLAHFLRFRYVPEPWTIFRDVKSLHPGGGIRIGRETREVLDYGKALFSAGGSQRGVAPQEVDGYLEHMEAGLVRSTRERVRGGKAGLWLSGGKDSGALAIAVSRNPDLDVHCFTVGFDNSVSDESSRATALARHLGLRHEVVRVANSDCAGAFVRWIGALGQPFGDLALIPYAVAFEAVRSRVDLFLDGTGSDLYFGIPPSRSQQIAGQILKWGGSRGARIMRSCFRKRDFAKLLDRRWEALFISWNSWRDEEIEAIMGLRPDFSECAWYRLLADLRHRSLLEIETNLVGLVWEPSTVYRKGIQIADRANAMIAFPWADRRLARFARGLPKSLMYQGQVNKILVRKYLAQHLPPELANLPKRYFVAPRSAILDPDRNPWVLEYLDPSRIRAEGLLDPVITDAYVQRWRSGDSALEDRILALLIWEVWHASFSASAGSTRRALAG